MHSFIGFEDVSRILIENGADVNAVLINNESPLLVAAATGNIPNVPIIIRYFSIFGKIFNINQYQTSLRSDIVLMRAKGGVNFENV